ncbi:Lin0368 family putative glycerol transporter subunit [Enterobacter hormaechei]|uniref:Lin0368 family putative glycerol transporter subunit n=1 Tax=Enterobacter hormaechei TaxID=158836 RepID=UPI002DBDB50C|nr:hypothetical protein [Enterobacter hormaechei]MEB7375040.1 hypothetical protein [Enterobacter hormaechei]
MSMIRPLVGYTITSAIVGVLWFKVVEHGGMMFGVLCGPLVIAPLWYLNHYLNLVDNRSDAAFVDIGLPIGICCILRDTFLSDLSSLINAIPTILIVCCGAIFGGLLAAYLEKELINEKNEAKDETGLNALEPGMNIKEIEIINNRRKTV